MNHSYRFFDFPSQRDDSEFIIIGVPIDGEMTHNRGSCTNAPEVIRRTSLDLSFASEDGTDLNFLQIADIGDIPKDIRLDNLVETIMKILEQESKSIPIFIGGSHFISYYTVKSLLQQKSFDNLHYFSLDAHLDCYNEWNGNKYTHCTVTRRIFESLGSDPKKVQVIGTRDMDLPEMDWIKRMGVKFTTMNEYSDKNKEIISSGKGPKPAAYISIDIDVFDPSVAPGTGYPIPGGIVYRDYFHILDQIIQHYTIVGIDFVEYSPELDLPNKMTAFLVSKLIIETILRIKKEK